MFDKKPKAQYYYSYRYKPKRQYSATFILIIINVICFIIGFVLIKLSIQNLMQDIALQPSLFLQKPWTLITSMFMHANIFHIAVNMLSLFFLGSFVEKLINKKRFIGIYLLSGIIGGLFFILFSFSPLNGIPGLGISNLDMMAVGASGAIFGLGGLLAVLTPKVPVYIMFIPIAMPLWLGITIMFVVLLLITAGAGLPIGNAAHLGGLLTGLAYGFYLRKKYKKKIALLDRYFRR